MVERGWALRAGSTMGATGGQPATGGGPAAPGGPGAAAGVGYFTRSTYVPSRVSTRMVSPGFTKGGTWMTTPVSRVAGL